MNEKFLSRGKRIEHDFYGLGGEWVYGIPIQTHIGTFICFEENPHYCGQYGYMEIEELSKVIPETVGRCIGLTDKNGKMIFEGDIIRRENGEIFEIAYVKKYMRFVARRPGTVFSTFSMDNVEVIGNIHDNPTMLSRADMPVANDVFQPTTPEIFELMRG